MSSGGFSAGNVQRLPSLRPTGISTPALKHGEHVLTDASGGIIHLVLTGPV
jgi:hypothetical protein